MIATIRQHQASDTELTDILNLIRSAFAYMDAHISPPSSMHRLQVSDIAELCDTGEVWSLGNPIYACMVLKLKPDALYLGRLAISENQQRHGIGKQLVKHAIRRARELGKPIVEIETRVELTHNHLFFTKLGFTTVAERTHEGYDQPTYIVMQRPVER